MHQVSKVELELAWAAGFFDGEGTTICVITAHKTRRLDFICSQVVKATLERFRRALGDIGVIQGPRIQPNRQPIYRYVATGAQAQRAVMSLWPYLSPPKRDQALIALNKYVFRSVGRRGTITHCFRGHSMSDAYISKHGGRECQTCRDMRRSGKLPIARSPLAIELGIGIRQYTPPNIRKAHEASAWTFNIPVEKYMPAIET